MRIWILVILYFPVKSRNYFYLCYTYLRWVDNYVDNPWNNKSDKIKFIENQLNLIDCLSNGENNDVSLHNRLKYKEELLLYYFIGYTRQINNCNLIFEVKRSVESVLLDAKRLMNDGIYSNKEFDQYIEKSSKPLFNIIYYFLFPSARTLDEKKSIGNFIGYVATYRDYFKDLEAGYINIGREDILKYNLDINDPRDVRKLSKWMADKYPQLLQLMFEEIAVLKSMQMKLRFFWLGPYWVVLNLLIRIKVYDYRFGMKYKKSLIKELIVFMESCFLSLKLFIRIF